MKPILDKIFELKRFKTLLKALKSVDLQDDLSGTEPFTLLAPTDEAFAILYVDILDVLFRDPIKLIDVLNNHLIHETITIKDALKLPKITAINGEALDFHLNGKFVKVNHAVIFEQDIICSNGIVHLVDSVLMPKNYWKKIHNK